MSSTNHDGTIKIKSEVDRSSLQISELNIKTECDSRFDIDESENSLQPLYLEKEENVTDKINYLLQDKYFKCENTDDSSDGNDALSKMSLTDLRKACILQTCLNLLDSSSSDEDELMLLWLLQRNRKKKFTKRRRL